MNQILSLIILSFICLSQLDAQVMLRMERRGKVKTQAFHEGQELTVWLKGEDGFHTIFIKKMYPETGMILTQLGPIQVENIEKIRIYKSKKMGKALAWSFWNFGLAWGFYSLIDALVGGTLTWSILIVMGITGLLGLIFFKLFRHKTYKIGKKRRLRILDMTLEPPAPRP